MESINLRISKVINYYCKTKKEFYQEFGRTKQWVSNITKEGFPVGANTIKEIVSKFPNVNADWLLTGDGSMIKSDKTKKLIPQNESLVFNQNGKPVTNSLLVAEKFEKEHRVVITAIRNIVYSSQNCEQFFVSTTYTDNSGKSNPMYIMNRDGFTLLAMGFTGKKALEFKLQYIEAFNKMEEALKSTNTSELQMAYGLIAAQKIIDNKIAHINILELEKKALVKENEILQPKADFLDKAVLTSDSKVDIGQAAKILKLSYGRNTLFQKLRNSGIFFKYKNEPKQEYVDRGYFEVFEVPYEQNGKMLLSLKVLVTQSGLCWLNKTLNGNMFNQQIAQFN